jgi:acid phosphatase family membrane protein YuiD
MTYLLELIRNEILITAILSWFIAQFIKLVLVLITDRKLDFTRLTGSGGMPSSHSSFTVSLAAATGFEAGFDSVVFALALAFSLVVMYDASGIRRSAGQQAVILNQIVEKLGKEGFSQTSKKLKELLGHTPLEVFAGVLI